MKASVRELLSAYLDDELLPRHRQLVEKALRQSVKVRALLAEMQWTKERLRQLPRQSLPREFSSTVLQEIAGRRIRIDRPRAYWHSGWVRLSLAAAVMIGIGLGAAALGRWFRTADPQLADTEPPGRPEPPSKPEPPRPEKVVKKFDWEAWRQSFPSSDDLDRLAARGRLIIAPLADGLAGAFDAGSRQLVRVFEFKTPEHQPPFGKPSIITAPLEVNKRFKTIDVKLPLFMEVADFDLKKLLNHLEEDALHHLDLSCDQAGKSLERLQNACIAADIKLLIDPEVKQRLERRHAAPFMIYLENTTPAQVARLLLHLQVEDRKAEEKRKGDGQFYTLMLQVLDGEGRKQVAEALGVPVNSLAPLKSRAAPRSTVDLTRPIWYETLKMLDQLLEGRGGVKMGPQKEPTALLAVYHPNRSRAPFAKEVRHYLDTRPDWQPKAIHLIILLRPQRA